jgi:hypothetical protein
MSSLEKRMKTARDVGRRHFLELASPAISNEPYSYRIEFKLTRWMFWGLELRKGDYLVHYFRTTDTEISGYRHDWTSSRKLALLLYLIPLVDHLTYYHKLNVGNRTMRRIHDLTIDPSDISAIQLITILYENTNCGELRKLLRV